MNEQEYEKLIKDIRQISQKIANDIFAKRRTCIMNELKQNGIIIDEDQLVLKKGRPKKKT